MDNKSSKKCLLFPMPNPAASVRLFCFHYAGGSAQVFYDWPGRLPPSVEVVAIQLPGRGHRLHEPHIKELVSLSRAIAHALLPYLDKPFVFFGHSLGALLCFETARSLRRENHRQPTHLFVSATEAPHRRSREEPLHKLPKDELVKKLKEFNGTPIEVLQNDELMNLLLPTIYADFELSDNYEYYQEPPLECPITIYGGVDDHELEAQRLEAWSEMTVGTSMTRMFPGDHFYINSSQEIFLKIFAVDLLRLRLQN